MEVDSRQAQTGNGLIFCLGKIRVCRLKAAEWRKRTGLGGVSVNPGPSSAPSDPVKESSLCVLSALLVGRFELGGRQQPAGADGEPPYVPTAGPTVEPVDDPLSGLGEDSS